MSEENKPICACGNMSENGELSSELTDGKGNTFDVHDLYKKVFDIGKPVDETDAKEFVRITSMISAADQMLRGENLPKNMDRELVKTYFEEAMKVKLSTVDLSSSWWFDVEKKYNLPKGRAIYFDMEKACFYTFMDRKNNVELFANDIEYQAELRGVYPKFEE